MNSRELIKATLEFKNTSCIVPRQIWILPWALDHYPDEVKRIQADFPDDITGIGAKLRMPTIEKGDQFEIGEYTDPWGCIFKNIQKGVIGEVKKPIVTDDDWQDSNLVHFPEEWLMFDNTHVNTAYANTDKFVLAGCCPRPFEQLQFIRGTAELYMDLLLKPSGMLRFIEKMHDFYCRLVTKWAQTDVDAIYFMDDWGSQKNLLISPSLWREIFGPMYRDYIAIAHKYGKKAFMHSDGYILDIYPDLIEMGLDAINSQIFCMGIEHLAQFKGKIAFWGEIDRQHLLPNGTTEDIQNSVRLVQNTLWDNGGCIAQCEFGPGSNPDNVYQVFETWQNFNR